MFDNWWWEDLLVSVVLPAYSSFFDAPHLADASACPGSEVFAVDDFFPVVMLEDVGFFAKALVGDHVVHVF
jgi:hypothetical protein